MESSYVYKVWGSSYTLEAEYCWALLRGVKQIGPVVADGNESNCIIDDYFVTPQCVILNSLKHCADSADHLVQHLETLNFANRV